MNVSKILRLALAGCLTVAAASSATVAMKAGKAELKSAGPLAFSPDGILFAGDSIGGAIFAIDTDDRAAKPASKIEVKAVNQKIAALLGTTPDQILIADMIVNPVSKNVYFSVSRGRGADATPMILKMDASGKLTEVPLANIKHQSVSLPDAPAPREGNRNPRLETITDMAFVDGKVLIAGLSNEEFSSSLRAIPFPFEQANKAASIEIYHGNHGRFETNSPVRTFVPYTLANQQYILAAYTCTPLVKIPVSELKPGAKVKGTTIAELGNRNRPLDMVVYKKDGKDWILMANSSRGVMKMPANGLDKFGAITSPVEDKAGVSYETIAELKGVEQLDKLDEANSLMLINDGGSLDVRTVALP
jgi:hypothetical protein